MTKKNSFLFYKYQLSLLFVLAPIVVEILLCRCSAQKIGTDSGISSWKKLFSSFLKTKKALWVSYLECFLFWINFNLIIIILDFRIQILDSLTSLFYCLYSIFFKKRLFKISNSFFQPMQIFVCTYITNGWFWSI